MVKTLRAVAFFCAFLLSLSWLNPTALAKASLPEKTEEYYVADFVGCLTPEQKEAMVTASERLAKQFEDAKLDGTQVVTAIVETTGSTPMERYKVLLANEWRVGKDGRGILNVLATEDRELGTSIGAALEPIIPDQDSKRITKNAGWDYLTKSDWGNAMYAMHMALVKEAEVRLEKEAEYLSTTSAGESDTASTSKPATTVPTDKPSTITPANKPSTESTNKPSTTSTKESAYFEVILVMAAVMGGMLLIALKSRYNLIKRHKREVREAEERGRKSSEGTISTLKSQREASDRRASELEGKLRASREASDRRASELEGQIREHSVTISGLKDFIDRAKRLHAGLDGEVAADIKREKDEKDRVAASAFDAEAKQYSHSKASSGIINQLNAVIRKYEKLTRPQCQYVTVDIQGLRNLLSESEKIRDREQAKAAEDEIRSEINGLERGHEKEISRIKRANGIITRQSSAVQALIGSQLKTKVERLLREAEKERHDREEAEEAERRRRQREEEERRRRQREEEERRRRQREEEERRRRRQREEEARRNSYSSYGGLGSSGHHNSGLGGFSGHRGGGSGLSGF